MSDELTAVIQIFTVIVMPLLAWFSVQSYRISKSEKKLIKQLEARNDVLFMRVNKIEDERDAVEKLAYDYRKRVMSLEEDLRIMRNQMVEIESQNRQLRRRVRVTLNAIRESRPDWQLPKDENENDK